MQPPAITLIKQEHQALTTVLRALRQSVKRVGKSGQPPDFDGLRAMLFYLDEMPARVHHANESELLFPRIYERCPALRPVLDRLQAEHSRGESAVRELEHALTGWQIMGNERREAFELLLHAYSEDYLGHMEVEESYVLPVAMDYLSPADWSELGAAFTRQRGALAESIARGHRELFERIASNQSLS
ncbi:MAG: hemerythrin domain-containing protein [Rhodoferax sp.]|nr:hemerythrin domain-containing protein [Rhodoferax sp.]